MSVDVQVAADMKRAAGKGNIARLPITATHLVSMLSACCRSCTTIMRHQHMQAAGDPHAKAFVYFCDIFRYAR